MNVLLEAILSRSYKVCFISIKRTLEIEALQLLLPSIASRIIKFLLTTIVVNCIDYNCSQIKVRAMRKLFTASVAIGVLLQACAQHITTPARDRCSKIPQPCYEVGNFAVIGETREAERYLDIMKRAARDYQTYFENEPVPTALVMSSKVPPETIVEIEGAGYVKTLPWLDTDAKGKLQEQEITKQLADQIKHLPEAAQKQAMESLKAQLSSSEPALSLDKESGVLAHELGHLWFMAQFADPSGEVGKKYAYGGWAPDWLDESAAVLMENAVLRDSRREQLKVLGEAQLIELKTFLTMEHPLAQAVKDLVKDRQSHGGEQVVFLTGDEADKFLEESGQSDAGNFYLQVSGFVAFMIEQTGDKAIFAKIASHFSQGGDLSSWTETTAQFENLAELESTWLAWVKQL